MSGIICWNVTHIKVSKQTKRKCQRKNFTLFNGIVLKPECDHRIMMCRKEALAESHMQSKRHTGSMAANPKRILTFQTANERRQLHLHFALSSVVSAVNASSLRYERDENGVSGKRAVNLVVSHGLV